MATDSENHTNITIESSIWSLTNLNVGYEEDSFGFLMISGHSGRWYHLSPKHAKRALMLLTKKLDDYERKHGRIKAELPKEAPKDAKGNFGFIELDEKRLQAEDASIEQEQAKKQPERQKVVARNKRKR